MQILVRTLSGKTIPLEVESSDTIKDVKEKIRDMQRISYGKLILLYDRKQLEDDKTLSDYNIKDQDTLYLLISFRGGMQIFVKKLNGKTLTLEVNRTDTIKEVKGKIEEKDGSPPGMQKLLFNRQCLEDGATLSDCNVSNGSSVHLVRNLAGHYNIVKLKK